MKKKKSFLKGHLLVAAPHLKDEVFRSSVIFICTHDDRGALGLIVNRPLETITFMELMVQLDVKGPSMYDDKMIYFGGPIDVNRGFILHEPLDNHPESAEAEITPEISLSTSLHTFKKSSFISSPKNLLVAVGYAGWSEGQLEEEIRAGDWLALPAESHFIFHTPPAQLWDQAYAKLDIKPYMVSDRVGFA